MPAILILTQKAVGSVQKLKEALIDQANNKYNIFVWEINADQTARLEHNCLKLVPKQANADSEFHQESILLADLGLVIKRTWGPIREEVLDICKQLESYNVPISHGCDFIEWCHSKISQYRRLEGTGFIPKHICYDEDYIKEVNDANKEEKFNEIIAAAKSKLGFPLILKLAKSCRGAGVYRLESATSLQRLLENFYGAKDKGFFCVFILQEFIMTEANKDISTYYRVNIINGQPQSAACFQLCWEPDPKLPDDVNILKDFKDAKDEPVNIASFDQNILKEILEASLYRDGVVGLDVLLSNNRFFLLEFNSGPGILDIVNLGAQHSTINNNFDQNAAKQCAEFATEVAKACLKSAALHKQKRFTKYAVLASFALGFFYVGANILSNKMHSGDGFTPAPKP